MSRRCVAIVAAVIVLSSAVASAAEIRACVHKNTGALRIVTEAAACNPANESPLSWTTGGTSNGFRVLDSKDALVGRLLDSGLVVRFIDGHWFAPHVTKSGFVELGLFYLYESSDCTGQPYLEDYGRIPEWGGSALGGGGTLTIYYPAEPIVPRTIRSSRSVFSKGPTQPCLGPLDFPGVPVGVPASTTLTATPPFRLVE